MALAVLVGLLLLLFGALVSAEPAVADNCKELVKGIGDLANESKMQDCLRTGDWIGKTVGIVVGTAGIVIASMGLLPTRKPIEVPPASPSSQIGLQSKDPCIRLIPRGRRLQELEAERKKLEAEILKEFQEIADKAQFYVQIYADLQEAWYYCRKCAVEAALFNAATAELVIVGLLYSVRKVAAKGLSLAGRAVPLTLEPKWTLMMATSSKAAIDFATEIARLTVGTSAAVATIKKEWFTDKRLKPSLSDFFGSKVMENMLQDVVAKGMVPYIRAAKAFNHDVAQWGVDRQQDIDVIMRAIKDEAAQWNADSAACAEQRAKDQDFLSSIFSSPSADPPPYVGSLEGPFELQLPQVRTDFDQSWLLGARWAGIPAFGS
jgi:hypothetical protein